MKCSNCGAENPEGTAVCASCGTQLGPTGPAPPSRGLRMNVLCLLGAIIGVVAIFLAWLTMSAMGFSVDADLTDALDMPSSELGYTAAILFIVGSVMAFLTSIGFIIQLAGVAAWYVWYADTYQGMGSVVDLGVGFYLGVVSAVIVLISIVKPMGPGMKGPYTLKQRLMTFTRG